jgi:hypothetical protein
MTTLHDFGCDLGVTFGHSLLGSQNYMVTVLGSCVKWSNSPMTHVIVLSVEMKRSER